MNTKAISYWLIRLLPIWYPFQGIFNLIMLEKVKHTRLKKKTPLTTTTKHQDTNMSLNDRMTSLCSPCLHLPSNLFRDFLPQEIPLYSHVQSPNGTHSVTSQVSLHIGVSAADPRYQLHSKTQDCNQSKVLLLC